MAEVAASTGTNATASPGLLARWVGAIVSPHQAYTAVAERPRVFGALALTLAVMITCQSAFLFTDVGKQALLAQQVKSIEAFGMTVTDQAYAQMQSRLASAPYTGALSQLIVMPLMIAVIAGLLYLVFNALMGGNRTYKHVYAVVTHAWGILAIQQLFSMPLSYAKGEFASATLDVFFPMLEEKTFMSMLLGSIDLFAIWGLINLAIGVGILYKRKTTAIAWSLIGVYIGIVVVITSIRSVS